MEKLLNVENDWDGGADCPDVMGPCCLISEEEVTATIKGLSIGNSPGPTGLVSEMMKTSGSFGTRWMTDLIKTILSKKAASQMIGDTVSWSLCTRGKVIHLCTVYTELYWSSR